MTSLNSNEPSSAAWAEIERIKRRKIRVYQLALVIAVLTILVSWWLRDPSDVFLGRVYPLFGFLFTFLWLAITRGWLSLRTLEMVAFAAAAGLILSRLAWHFHFSAPLPESLLVLVGGHYWAVAVLMVTSAVVLDRRRGLVASVTIYLLSVVIAATGVWRDALAGPLDSTALGYLVRVHLFLIILLVPSYLATLIREDHFAALHRARTMDHWAYTDSLTGLHNRRSVEHFLHRAMTEHKTPLSVILLDIDYFKSVNDTLGHTEGDAVLKEVARRLSRQVRDTDCVSRWGGEEFLIVAPNTNEAAAIELAERCRAEVSRQPISGLHITGTFGVCEWQPGEAVNDLFKTVDNRLYEGKRAGRNRIIGAKDVVTAVND